MKSKSRLPSKRPAFGLHRFLIALLSSFTLSAPAFAQPPAPTLLTLTADTLSAPVHTVIHLTAALQTSSSPTGSVTFLDNTQPLITLPLTNQGTAVLAIASLPQGSHILTATYSGDAAHASSASAPIAISVVSLPSTPTLTSTASTAYAGTPITLTAAGLSSPATGTFTFTDAASTIASTPITGTRTPLYHALGDSITYGYLLPSDASRYVNLFAADYGFTLADLGYPGSIACDVLPFQILTNSYNPTQAASPLTSLLIGTNDIDYRGNQPYQPIFQACHQAALAWLAIPREYKVLPGDPAAAPLTGAWTSNPGAFDLTTYGTLFNNSGSGSARFSTTSTGAPLYLWYLMGDNLSGTFTLALDGISTAVTYSTHPSTPIASIIAANSVGIGYSLLRLPAAAGPHVIDIAVQSGTVGILAVATPPSPGIASVHPTVLAGDIPNQLASNPQAAPSVLAQYTQYAQQDIALLQADGLDLRPVPTQQFMLGSAAEMSDQVHPNALGDIHLEAAFKSVFANSPIAPYAPFANAPASASVTLSTPGVHTLAAAYSGDNVYAAATSSPITITVLPQVDSTTTLSARATRFNAGDAIAFTSTVAPASATGTITFYDGTTLLAQLPLTSGVATFTASTLSPGLHNLTASYSGDSPDTPSGSPALTIQIGKDAITLTLAPLPASASYGTALQLTGSISPASATGTVTFLDTFTPAAPNGVSNSGPAVPQQLTLGQAALATGTATQSLNTLLPGTHSITASYPGDFLDLAAASPALTVQIIARATSTTLTASPATLPYGAPETLTASVSPASATGTIAFSDALTGTLAQVPLVNGSATFPTSSLAPGTHTLTATYSGDTPNAASTSPSVSVQVNSAVTATVIAPIPASIAIGATLTLSATISPATATGTVLFRNATPGSGSQSTLGQAAVANGTATFTSNSLPAGSYSITALYSGDAGDAPSTSAPVSTQITLAPTTTTLAPLAASSPYATPLNLTATVSPATAGGQVTFTDSNAAAPLGTAILSNGVATLTLSNLPSGSHAIRAVYAGDTLDAPSTSSPALTTITGDPTSTTLSLALVNVPVGTPVIFNVRVTVPLGAIPSGIIAIRSGATVLASGPLANSAPGIAYATLSVNSTTLGLGTFPATAFYSGDLGDAPSDSSATSVNFTILPIPTLATLTLSSNQIPAQGSTTLTAKVTSSSQLPTGTVTFFQNAKAIATVPLDPSGTASTVLSGLPIGGYLITAAYNPTGLFAAFTVPAQDLTVSPPIAIALTPSSVSGGPSSAPTSTLVITPLFGFAGALQAQCQPSVSWIACTVDPLPAITSSAPVSAAVHVTIAATSLAAMHPPGPPSTILLALLLPFLAIGKARRPLLRVSALLLLCAATFHLTGCAQGGTFGNVPSGPHAVAITVTAGGTAFATTLTVNVTQ